MPLGKSRILPDWMAGAGDRVGLGNPKPAKSKPVAITKQAEHKSLPAKSTPKTKRLYEMCIFITVGRKDTC